MISHASMAAARRMYACSTVTAGPSLVMGCSLFEDILEGAVKRAESTVNKDRREAIESAALQKAWQEEKERQKAGKKAWHMKDCKRWFIP